jgi:hypothetical protein
VETAASQTDRVVQALAVQVFHQQFLVIALLVVLAVLVLTQRLL